jgi:hypothetical protein
MENNYKIPLCNRNKEIIDYTFVSKIDYELLNQYKWYKNNGYVVCAKLKYRLHRYIMIEILKNNINSNNVIDHIDNNPLNNKRCNLRIVTISENARNKTKQKDTISKYMGVSFDKRTNKYISSIKINKKQHNAYYTNEHYAAHQYNLWCQEYNFTTVKLNIIPIELLIGFTLYIKQERNDVLPQNIYFYKNNNYRVQINGKHIGIYNNLENAIQAKKNKLKELEEIKIKEFTTQVIQKNNEGYAIIKIKHKNKIYDIIVDDDIYYHIIQYNWYFNTSRYLHNNKLGLLHRYIMNLNDKNLVIDHINNNPLDNRKENLRIVTIKENSKNKSSHKNSSSKYIGVYWYKQINKWVSKIYINGSQKSLGYFENEIEAAIVRDTATKKYFGKYGNLNFN